MKRAHVSRFTAILAGAWVIGMAGMFAGIAAMALPMLAIVGWMIWRAWWRGV